jgi:hypothetical protein
MQMNHLVHIRAALPCRNKRPVQRLCSRVGLRILWRQWRRKISCLYRESNSLCPVHIISYVFLLLYLCILIVCMLCSVYSVLCSVYSVFIVPSGILRLPWLRIFRVFFSFIRQTPWYTSQKRGTARTLPKLVNCVVPCIVCVDCVVLCIVCV